MAAAVGVERGEQPVSADHLGQAAKARGGALLLDQKDRADRARRIVERDNQIERRLARQPLVRRADLEQHHPGQRPARPLLAMRRAARCDRHQSAAPQHRFGPGIARRKPVLGLQRFVEMLDRESQYRVRYCSTTNSIRSTAARRPDARPRRRSIRPSAPAASYRSRSRRKCRSLIFSSSAAIPCHPHLGLHPDPRFGTPPKTEQIVCYQTRTFHLLRTPAKPGFAKTWRFH